MFNANDLWKKRVTAHIKETTRYLRLMINDHLAFALLFFVAASAYYYQQWLKDLPEDFPTAWIMAIVFGLLVTYSPIRTLLKEADLVFLIPAETKLGIYFRNSILYSLMFQIYLLVFAAAAFAPLYFASFANHSGKNYGIFFGLVVVFKIWNLIASWWILKAPDQSTRVMDHVLRFCLNGVSFYFILQSDAWLYAGASTILLWCLFLYDYSISRKRNGIAWELLIEKEMARMQTFYRIANLFTDVPHLKRKAKRRMGLVRLVVGRLPFEKQKTFDFLYRIAFIRTGDYLGMYIRLIIIALLVVYWVPSIWVKVAFALLFLYLSGFQMMTLWNHFRTIDWIDLYPVPETLRRNAILKWLFILLILKTFILGLLFIYMNNMLGLSIVWLGGGLFSYLFIYEYVRKRLT